MSTTAHTRAYHRRNRQSENARTAAYGRSDAGRAAKARWRARVANDPDYRARMYAVQAVYRAVKAGRLVRPATCSSCGAGGRIEAHHHHGYDVEHRLDVVWLCRPCHDAGHHPEDA